MNKIYRNGKDLFAILLASDVRIFIRNKIISWYAVYLYNWLCHTANENVVLKKIWFLYKCRSWVHVEKEWGNKVSYRDDQQLKYTFCKIYILNIPKFTFKY